MRQAGHCRQAHRGQCRGRRRRGHAEARQGPIFRQRMAEADELQRKLLITRPRLREAQRQRDQASARLVSLKREIATINGDVANYKGETQTAAQRIKAAESSEGDLKHQDRSGPACCGLRARALRLPPAAATSAGWPSDPVRNLLNAMLARRRPKTGCAPSIAIPRTLPSGRARLFALNTGLVAFQARAPAAPSCAGRDHRRPAGLRTQLPAGFRPRLAGIDDPRRAAQAIDITGTTRRIVSS